MVPAETVRLSIIKMATNSGPKVIIMGMIASSIKFEHFLQREEPRIWLRFGWQLPQSVPE